MDQEELHISDEALKMENEFLKLKLMIEKGAKFMSGDEQLPPRIENEFLKYIQEFERQAEDPIRVRVFDKIGRPNFRPVHDIPDSEINTAWEQLSDHLLQHGVSLDVCSPNISSREMYRFAIEELFDYEMNDINIPGMVHGFIYDEFHPDPVYDNGVIAQECLINILSGQPLEELCCYRDERLQLNELFPLTKEEFRKQINHFKLAYDDIVHGGIRIIESRIQDLRGVVKGSYRATGVANGIEYNMKGCWQVLLEKSVDPGSWQVHDIQIEGIRF